MVGLQREQLGVAPRRVPKLLPLMGDAWHPRQGAAHLAVALGAAHHDAVAVVVEVCNRAFLQRGEERDRDGAVIEHRLGIGVAGRELLCCLHGGEHHIGAGSAGPLTGKVPKPVARRAVLDRRASPQADPTAAVGVVLSVECGRGARHTTGAQVLGDHGACQRRRVQTLLGPVGGGDEHAGRLGRVFRPRRLSIHVPDEVGVDVEHRRDAQPARQQLRGSLLVAKPDQADRSFDVKSRFLQSIRARPGRQPRADRVVDDHHRFRGVELAFDQFARAVLLGFLADQRSPVAAAACKDAPLQQWYAGQSVGRQLPALKGAEHVEQASGSQMCAARGERDSQRVEHPPRR